MAIRYTVSFSAIVAQNLASSAGHRFTNCSGESSSPPRNFGGGVGVACGYDLRTDVYNRLIKSGNEEAVSNPDFREFLDSHFNRLPASYGLDINIDRVEDVLLHRKLLALAKDPQKRPVFHVRCLENFWARIEDNEDDMPQGVLSVSEQSSDANDDKCVHGRCLCTWGQDY